MSSRRLALVMGVANHKSIAWATTRALLQRNFDCIVTYQSDRFAINKLVEKEKIIPGGNIIGSFVCNVEEPNAVSQLFERDLPQVLSNDEKLRCIVHNIAYCDMKKNGSRLADVDWSVYAQAQQISAYSLLDLARAAVQSNRVILPAVEETENPFTSMVALSYLGAVRATPNYQSMGPAKAALEAIVRQLSSEYGPSHGMHINAVSAGPISTLSARGIPEFSSLLRHVQATSPLRRSVTADEVARSVAFLASDMRGITGQTLYVDAGYSSVVPVGSA